MLKRLHLHGYRFNRLIFKCNPRETVVALRKNSKGYRVTLNNMEVYLEGLENTYNA